MTSCPGFKTYTQGGWGATPQGNNPGTFLQNNFAVAYPTGLTIGCGTKTIKLTSATAVRNFLPQGSTPSAISTALVNPTKSNYFNVFAGQLVAATINVRFDELFPNFGSSSLLLKNLIISTGPFAGWTVQQLLTEANKKIGG